MFIMNITSFLRLTFFFRSLQSFRLLNDNQLPPVHHLVSITICSLMTYCNTVFYFIRARKLYYIRNARKYFDHLVTVQTSILASFNYFLRNVLDVYLTRDRKLSFRIVSYTSLANEIA